MGAISAAIIDELRLNPELFSEISSRTVVRSILLADSDRRRVTVDRAAKLAALGRLRGELGLGRKFDLDAWAKQSKKEHRVELNYLAGTQGDAINTILAAAGYNFRLLLTWLRLLLRLMLAMLFGTLKPLHA